MQSPLIQHPPTPRYDLRFASKPASDAVRMALDAERDFSWLMTAAELEQVRMQAVREAAGWGYGANGRVYNGD